jgi:membrane protein implicated in regulation of membrane protease activity
MTASARRELAAAVRQGFALLVVRLDEVRPLMLAPTVLLLVLILAAVLAAVVVLAAAAVAVAVGLGIAACLRRALIAAVAYRGRKPAKEVPA